MRTGITTAPITNNIFTTTSVVRIALAIGMLVSLLVSASSAEAARRSPHVSWAPHLDRKLVPTRARHHGMQLTTWYGPGLFGNRTACGQTLRRSTWGIAHRTLPCGTLVTLHHHGRRVSVRVIDRGPFSGATVDLTSRTKSFLRFASGKVRMTEVKRYRLLPRVNVRR